MTEHVNGSICLSCQGTGRCTGCGGKGQVEQAGLTDECMNCFGSGVCSVCKGSGRRTEEQ